MEKQPVPFSPFSPMERMPLRTGIPIAVVAALACGLGAGCSKGQKGDGRASPTSRCEKLPRASGRVDSGRCSFVNVLDFGRRGVGEFVFCAATRLLYVSFADKKDDLLYEWDLDAGKVNHIYKLGEGYRCDGVAVSPDGRHLVVGCWHSDPNPGSKTALVDTASHRISPTSITGRAFRPSFSRDGKAFRTDGSAVAYDLSGKPIPVGDPDKTDPASDGRGFDCYPPKFEGRSGTLYRIESSKTTWERRGLYFRDASGGEHRLTRDECDDNYCLTADGKHVVATTRSGEVIVWRTTDAAEVIWLKLADHWGCLAYDKERNRVLLGDSTSDGTTFLRALVFPATQPGR